VLVLLPIAGCSRGAYRQWADKDAYCLLASRETDGRWDIPSRDVEPDSISRLADPNCPDCGPLPPDDPAAACYMRKSAASQRPIDYWAKRGELPSVENLHWLNYLPTGEDGVINVNNQTAVDLALIHNRDFQTQVELLHRIALNLSENRFEFLTNWFGGTDNGFASTRDGAFAERNVSAATRLGFSRNLASGGQFLTNIINSFNWQLGGNGNSNFATGGLLFQITQPLLRGAFRHVRTESLTQSERTLLYAVREFARFRRQFYFDTTRQYLSLLTQSQSIAIIEDNLRSLQLNLNEHNMLYDLDKVSPIQVDSVLQEYQSGRLRLLNARQSLQTSLDQFKFQLGLPFKVEIKIDESILKPFELNSPELIELQEAAEELNVELMKYLPPEIASDELLEKIYKQIKMLGQQLEEIQPDVRAEFDRWEARVNGDHADADEYEAVDWEQQETLATRNKKRFDDLVKQSAEVKKLTKKSLEDLDVITSPNAPQADEDNVPENSPADSDSAVRRWKNLQALISGPGGLKERINELFVLQTQIRLFLIDIRSLEIDEPTAIQIALENRLDLMNSRARVVDSYRAVEIAADQLESVLSVTASANLQTDPNVDNSFRFDGDRNQYNLGVSFDGPLNRFSERNQYRARQLDYQQQRRTYMSDEDSIVNGIRLNIRQLSTNRFNFLISRQQLIVAIRRVEQAQFNLRTDTSSDSSVTQDVLRALQDLQDTKTNLISSWINYEISRIALFVDLESLQLDDQGVWINQLQSTFVSEAVNQPQFEPAPLEPGQNGPEQNESQSENEDVSDRPNEGTDVEPRTSTDSATS
jgi:outer membrane protein TolC